MNSRSGKVQTVLGLVQPSELGHTQTHEHVLIDAPTHVSPGGTASSRRYLDDAIRLENFNFIRRNPGLCARNTSLDSLDDAVRALTLYKAAGGQSLVDSTSVGLGRDPSGLAHVSRTTGVNIIMGAGYYVRDVQPDVAAFDARSVEQMAQDIIRDVDEGVENGIRSGVIGEIGLSSPLHPSEARGLQAAALAQLETGAPLQIHPGRGPECPFEALKIVEEMGGDVTRTIMCHLDRTFRSSSEFLQLAETGCYLEMDLFGVQDSFYRLDPSFDMPNDAIRIKYLRALVEAGHLERLLIAQDVAVKVRLEQYGGEGYHHILERVLPQMRIRGWTDDEIETICVRNPGKALAFA